MFMRSTRRSRQFWRTRETGNPDYIAGYWTSRTHPLRQRIAKIIQELAPTSLLEVGCHCGPNLWAIRQICPDMSLAGVDVSPYVVAEGQKLCSGTAQLSIGRRATGSHDAVLASGTLLCVGDGEIGGMLRSIAKAARKHIVLVEPWPENPGIERYPNTTYWIRDYAPTLRRLGFAVTRRERLPDEETIGHINSLIVAERH